MRSARAALAAACICAPVIAFAQTAPSYQLIDLGYIDGNVSLRWQSTPPPLTSVSCPSIGGMGPSFYSEERFDESLLVGYAPNPQNYLHAIVCSPRNGGPSVDLGVLDGGPASYAYAVSDFNEYIVGVSQTTITPVPQRSGDVVIRAFISTGSGMTGLLSAMNDPHYSSTANAVNDVGEVAGSADMLFTSGPFAGQVGARAMVWEPGGAVYNLQFRVSNNPGVTLINALMVDCNGNIAAEGFPTNNYSDFNYHWYLLVRLNPTTQCPPNGPP